MTQVQAARLGAVSAPDPTPLRVHIVLGSGGVRTLGYAGALDELVERGVTFASISSCSAGTIFGACIAAGVKPAVLVERVLSLDMKRFIGRRTSPFSLLSAFRWPRARYRSSGIAALFQELVGGDLRFKDLTLPFSTIGVDLISARILVYSQVTTPDMPVSEALAIATAVPFLYPPHEPQDARERVVVDGALASSCPVWLAMQHADDLPIVAIAPRRSMVHPKREAMVPFIQTLVELGGRSRDLYAIDEMRRACLIELDASSVRWDNMMVSREERTELLAAGRAAAGKAMNEIRLLASGGIPGVVTRDVESTTGSSSFDAHAEAGGARLFARSLNRLASETRDGVFISYAHADVEWMNRVRIQLRGRLHDKPNPIWDDSQIPAGAEWRPTLDRALRNTKVAVLLVSGNFLGSDFIRDEELPAILAARAEGLVVVWALIGAGAYDKTPLKDIQAAHDPTRPIATIPSAEQDLVLDAISRHVELAIA